MLIERYGDAMTARLRDLFAARGLPPYAPPADVVPNTRAALRLGELAREQGVLDQYVDRVMDAY